MDNQVDNNNKNKDKENSFEDMLETYYSERLKNKLSLKLEEDYGVVRDKLPVPRRRILTVLSSIAATLAILVVCNLIFNPFGTDASQLAQNMLEETPLILPDDFNVRGESALFQIDASVQTALRDKNYTEVVRLYQSNESPEMRSDLNKFYFAVALIKSPEADIDKGINLLVDITNQQSPLTLEAQWYLALAYAQNRDLERAKSNLKYIIQNTNYKNEQAKKLLKQINTQT